MGQRRQVRTNRANVVVGGYAVSGIRQWRLKTLSPWRKGRGAAVLVNTTSALSVFATTAISVGG